jgi:hypothetical protein
MARTSGNDLPMGQHVGQDGGAEGFGLAEVDAAFKQGVAGDHGLTAIILSLHLPLNHQ